MGGNSFKIALSPLGKTTSLIRKKMLLIAFYSSITKTRLFKYIENVTTKKINILKVLIFFIFLLKT